jgi:hypothetical protein
MSPVNILDFSGEIVGVCRYKFPGWKYFTVEIPLTHTHRWKVQASMGYDGYGYKGLIWVNFAFARLPKVWVIRSIG